MKNYKNDWEERLRGLVDDSREQARNQRLSGATRTRILREATREEGLESPLPAFFTPTRRLVLAGGLPVVLTVALLVGLDRGAQDRGERSAGAGPVVTVSKADGEVRFDIRNGHKDYRVYRAADPQGFDRKRSVRVTDGRYSETLAEPVELVFYRIE
jgi:hypothetical protein